MSDSPQVCVVQEDKDHQDVCESVNVTTENGQKPVPGDSNHTRTDASDSPVPDSVLCHRIIKQVEFYFSDANLQKDTFLLSHIRRNVMGFVSLLLIASFKRMKGLTRDVQVIVNSLRQSEELEVNEDGTEVRRKNPLSEPDGTSPFRTVVAVNLGHNPSIDSVKEMFGTCGDVQHVRILRPGQPISGDVAKFANRHPEIGSSTATCVLVEFKTQEQAKHACDVMTNTQDWRFGMRVVLLDSSNKHKTAKQTKDTHNLQKKQPVSKSNKKTTTGDGPSDTSSEGNGAGEAQAPSNAHNKKKKPKRRKKPASNEGSSENNSDGNASGKAQALNNPVGPSLESSSETQNGIQQYHSNGYARPPLSNVTPNSSVRRQRHPKSSSESKFKPAHKMEPDQARSRGSSPPSNPWILRRLNAAQSARPMTGHSNSQSMMGVLRQPKGPDGSKGFYGGLGRGTVLVTY